MPKVAIVVKSPLTSEEINAGNSIYDLKSLNVMSIVMLSAYIDGRRVRRVRVRNGLKTAVSASLLDPALEKRTKFGPPP